MKRALLSRSGRRLRGDEKGLALVEFAIALPILLTLYLGGFEIEDGIACNRKITIATRAAADLLSQNQSGTTSASEVDGDLNAATLILAPYPTSNATLRVTEVTVGNNLQATVQWSRAKNGTAYTPNAVVSIPAQMLIPGTYYLFAEVSYAYKPSIGAGFVTPMTLKDSIYMLPRNSSQITCPDC